MDGEAGVLEQTVLDQKDSLGAGVYKGKWEPQFNAFRGGPKTRTPDWMILISRQCGDHGEFYFYIKSKKNLILSNG